MVADYSKTFRDAVKLDVNRVAAANMRIRYLEERIKHYDNFTSEVAQVWKYELLCEIDYLNEYKNIKRKKDDHYFTEEQIIQARDISIETIIEFDRSGKTIAWCHDDTSPSLMWWKAGNMAVCWPCGGKRFDTIDAVMHIQGLSFPEAVKYLIGE